MTIESQNKSALSWWRQLLNVQKEDWAQWYFKKSAENLSEDEIVELYWAIAE